MRTIVASLALAAALAGGPAATQAVKLLANNVHLTNTQTGTTAQVQVTVGPYRTDALVLVSAQGISHYSGHKGVNSGIVVGIVEDHILVEDDSFEGTSNNIIYRAAVSHSFLLKAGTSRVVKARTLPYGSASAGNAGTSISMDLAAIAVTP